MENLVFIIIGEVIVQAVFFLYPSWRIFRKSGLNPLLGLTVLIPAIGFLISGLILVLFKWKVQPVWGN